MDRYEVERIVAEKTRHHISLNNRINQCAFCGDTVQKVCWNCFETTRKELQNQIDGLQKQLTVINALLKANGIQRPPQIAAK